MLQPGRPLPLKDRENEIFIHQLMPGPQDATAAPTTDERHGALKRLLAQQLPASDWEQMEEESIRGAVDRPDCVIADKN